MRSLGRLTQEKVIGCVAIGMLVATLPVACGRSNGVEQFVPEASKARAALEAVLAGWQAGDSPQHLDRLVPPVEVVDTHRLPGQTLERFEVLGEVPGQTGRSFAVRLSLKNPAEDARVRYIVVGIDPLWVYRQEDYDMLAHWDHVMETPDEAEPETGDAPLAGDRTAGGNPAESAPPAGAGDDRRPTSE